MRQLLAWVVSITAIIGLGTIAAKVAIATPDVAGVLIAQKPNCNNPQTQGEMNACAGLSYQQADKRLNQVYQQLVPKLSAARRQKLTSAQQTWIKFRDSNCAFQRSEVEGGSMAPMMYSSCLAEMTKQRTQQLEEYIRDIK